jgi:hypothetical protein
MLFGYWAQVTTYGASIELPGDSTADMKVAIVLELCRLGTLFDMLLNVRQLKKYLDTLGAALRTAPSHMPPGHDVRVAGQRTAAA